MQNIAGLYKNRQRIGKNYNATMQAFLSNKRLNTLTGDEACSTVIYRPSISNQVNIVHLLLEDCFNNMKLLVAMMWMMWRYIFPYTLSQVGNRRLPENKNFTFRTILFQSPHLFIFGTNDKHGKIWVDFSRDYFEMEGEGVKSPPPPCSFKTL